jgi:threonine synthase
MRYVSTRGGGEPRRFCEILLEGLAPDGGLYVPAHVPTIDFRTLRDWRRLSYAELAFEVLRRFVDDVPEGELLRLARATYTREAFGSEAIVPLKRLPANGLVPAGELSLLALSNGPTLAFKDLAMQLLGRLFEFELGRRGERLNVLGATSGDTGSAAEHALRGRARIAVFMLSPHGRMSPFQQAQMYGLHEPNIHNLAVQGVFDDCQDIVKAVGTDTAFKARHAIGTVNSINWARLVAQVVYYFAGYFQATREDGAPVSFCVPSGNFGNVHAGHVARSMGLPIGQLVVATNENDVLDEFFRTGRYAPRAARATLATSSPSMDISKASNFERFVFDLVGRDPGRVRQLFGEVLPREGAFRVTATEHLRCADFGFASGRSTHAHRVATIRALAREAHTLIDPHTADGVHVARAHVQARVPMVVLETALPAKFAATMFEATGAEPPRPPGFERVEALPQRFTVLPADVDAVRAHVAAHAI